MKRDFSKPVVDRIEKKPAASGPVKKEKSSKRRLSIYDDFDDEDDYDMFGSKSFKHQKSKR